MSNLETVFACLDKAGLRIKRSKCEFMQTSVTYLGHKIDEKQEYIIRRRECRLNSLFARVLGLRKVT